MGERRASPWFYKYAASGQHAKDQLPPARLDAASFFLAV
jgi:hypothetical protein